MELVADRTKVLDAYRIINHQLALGNQQLKKDLRLSEERFNESCDTLLRARLENKNLRDMVRKLKDQLQMITKVMVSVQDQSERVFELINRPHNMAEEMERNRQARAPQVYEHMRLENPPAVHEAVILEEAGDGNDTTTTEEDEPSRRSSDMALSETHNPMTTRELPVFSAGPLLPSSPLVQRLKRLSKNTSFDESFETIERERVFKLSRHSRERRQVYPGLTEMPNSIRETRPTDRSESFERSIVVPSVEHADKSEECFEMEIDETLSATLQNISPVRIDEENSSSSICSKHQQPQSGTGITGNPLSSLLKQKTVSESNAVRMFRSTVVRKEDSGSSSGGEDNPEDTIANASCSTPVAKSSKAVKSSCIQVLSRGRDASNNIDAVALKRINKLVPLVVVQPLTEENVRSLGKVINHTSKRQARKGKYAKDEEGESVAGRSNCDTTALEPSSSTENLSVASNESGRPRRKAAPTSLREPSLGRKMRRK